jgi:protein-S-isoprenylcysteine O-methyltransferase Ste14
MTAAEMVRMAADKSQDDTQAALDMGVGPGAPNLSEWGARALIVLVFTALAFLTLIGILQKLPIDSVQKILDIAASIANFFFLALVAATALTRLRPVLKAGGFEPRASAFVGTLLGMALCQVPKADLGPTLSVMSTILIIVGGTCSYVVLRWLGKSFSLFAEARRLVTAGPYSLVRHPLYLCEGIALVGVTLQVMSPEAVVILTAIVLLQFRRILNEEAVLRSAFPEYRDYAARTPRVFPNVGKLACECFFKPKLGH